MRRTEPQISVVVSTFNRSHLLPRLIASLEAQQGAPAFEVIVVDDGSTDDTTAVLEQLASASELDLRLHHIEHNFGPCIARNLGWRTARSPLIAFTDDDCRPDPRWLASLVAAFDEADVVQGRTTFDPAEAAGRGPFSEVVAVDRWSGQFETSNAGYRRDLLERLGGFDERYDGDSFGEDVDLGWRAIEVGARTAWAQEAVVTHDVKRAPALQELRASLRHGRRWRHIGLVLRDHPGYRPHRLYRGPFLAATDPPTLLALAGLVAILAGARRGPAAAVAAAAWLPWLRHRTVVEPRPGSRQWRYLPVVLPAAFAVDATKTLTVAGSGLRYGILVL